MQQPREVPHCSAVAPTTDGGEEFDVDRQQRRPVGGSGALFSWSVVLPGHRPATGGPRPGRCRCPLRVRRGGRAAPFAPVEPDATVAPLPSTQVIVDDVPPSTCELSDVVISVSGLLWKLTVAPTYGLSEQAAVLSMVTDLSSPSTW
jgi:hypothetical protein